MVRQFIQLWTLFTNGHSLLPLSKQSIIKLKIATGTVVVKVEVSACNYCDPVYALVNTENSNERGAELHIRTSRVFFKNKTLNSTLIQHSSSNRGQLTYGRKLFIIEKQVYFIFTAAL